MSFHPTPEPRCSAGGQVDRGRHWGLMAQTNWEQTGPGWISACTGQGCLNRSQKFMLILDYKLAPAGPGIQLWVTCNEVQVQEFIKFLWDQAGIKQCLKAALLIYMHLKICKLYFCVKKCHQSLIRYSCWKGLLVSPHIEQHCVSMLILTAYSQVPLTVSWPVLADNSSTKYTLYWLWVFQSNETQKIKEKPK